MSVTVTFVLGLAGSGKTTRAKRIQMQTGATIFDGIFGPANARTMHEFLESVRAGMSCVVEEIAYCDAANRPEIVRVIHSVAPHANLVWDYFENDLASANWNVENRNDPEKPDIAGHLRWNEMWHRNYNIPAGVVPIPIVRCKKL